ncbi:S41 family peptidase [Chitinophaga sp.]|uniref:S41 family peptidase n=1 Tax=Chitinophaga sp. TaxID=1869181 RepID=UPI0031D6EB20
MNVKNWIFPLTLLLGTNISQAQSTLSRRQAIADIDEYTRTLQASHYAPFMHVSQKDYNAGVDKIKRSIGDSIHTRDLVWTFYRITALLGDAHSTPQLGQPFFRDEMKKDQFFPYKLAQDKHRIYIPAKLAADLGIPAGAEITDINGRKMDALYEEILSGMAGLPSFREEASSRLLSYFLFLKGIQPPFVLSYKDNKGLTGSTVISAGVPFRQALAATMPHIAQPYTYRLLNNKLGYIDVRSLSGNVNAFRTFLDSCFREFKTAGIRHLAIDLRQNSGGNTLLVDLLFSYITHKKYSWGRKSWKISQPYKDMLIAGGDTTDSYLQHANGTVWESEDCIPKEGPFKRDTVFDGKVYFITGAFTFSSAMAMADVVKVYGLGTILGEPTGENVIDFGEAFPIVLPNSGIRIQSTTSLSHGADCNRTKNGPVLPDVAMKPQLQDKIWDKDPVLKYLIKTVH